MIFFVFVFETHFYNKNEKKKEELGSVSIRVCVCVGVCLSVCAYIIFYLNAEEMQSCIFIYLFIFFFLQFHFALENTILSLWSGRSEFNAIQDVVHITEPVKPIIFFIFFGFAINTYTTHNRRQDINRERKREPSECGRIRVLMQFLSPPYYHILYIHVQYYTSIHCILGNNSEKRTKECKK